MNDEIKPGDAVQLNSGGPHMTVELLHEDEHARSADVVWYDADTFKMETRRIKVAALNKVKSSE